MPTTMPRRRRRTAATDARPATSSAPRLQDAARPARRRAPRIHVPDGDRPSRRTGAARSGAPAPPTPEAVSTGGRRTSRPSRRHRGRRSRAHGRRRSADGAAPVKKKTRRGSRGGRNRRKRPAGAGERGDESAATTRAAADEVESARPTASDGAVPCARPPRPENGAAPAADVTPSDMRPPAPPRRAEPVEASPGGCCAEATSRSPADGVAEPVRVRARGRGRLRADVGVDRGLRCPRPRERLRGRHVRYNPAARGHLTRVFLVRRPEA